MTQLTKEHFDKVIRTLAKNDRLNALAGVVDDYQSKAAARFDGIDTSMGTIAEQLRRIAETLIDQQVKLDAIMQALAMRQEVRNLVRELKLRGVDLDATKIFVSGV